MSLEQEIERAALQVSTDAFSLTIGEIVNMYRDGDIIINPEFQRLFRWDIERKSRLIESILVRIPLPPIFVFELPNSKWEVIDGLQRLSTVLEFMGELKHPDEAEFVRPRSLIGTQYLPSLRGAFWSDDLMRAQREFDDRRRTANTENFLDNSSTYYSFDRDTQRAIKRSKIGVQLLEKKSDQKSKYDLFQRLNSGGIAANDQEIRNCSIVMVNSDFFAQLETIAESRDFAKLIPTDKDSKLKSNHIANVCRVIAFSFVDYKLGTDIEEFITNALIDIASSDAAASATVFHELADGVRLLISACGYDALRPYVNGTFKGRVGRTSIEIVLVGLLRCLNNIRSKHDPEGFIREQIIRFWSSNDSKKFSAAGIAGTDRVQYTIPLGVSLFSE